MKVYGKKRLAPDLGVIGKVSKSSSYRIPDTNGLPTLSALEPMGWLEKCQE